MYLYLDIKNDSEQNVPISDYGKTLTFIKY